MVTLGFKLPRVNGNPSWTFDLTAGEWGRRVESFGYDSLWAAEGWGDNAFVQLAEVATQTSTLRLGTAIANVYSRSPAVLAMGVASLSRLSDGRAVLGLGASHPSFVEGLHNVDYDRPVRRCHESIELIRALTQGEDLVSYEGELFDVEGYPPLDEPVPIYNAALGKANRRATGRVADGWIPFLIPVSQLEDAYGTVADAARKANHDPNDVTVIPQILSSIHEDPETARDPVRRFIASYIGNFEAYRSIIADAYPEATAAVATAWQDDDEREAMDRIPEAMLQELGVAGTPEKGRERILEILDIEAIDSAIVYVPTAASRDILDKTMATLSPAELA